MRLSTATSAAPLHDNAFPFPSICFPREKPGECAVDRILRATDVCRTFPRRKKRLSTGRLPFWQGNYDVSPWSDDTRGRSRLYFSRSRRFARLHFGDLFSLWKTPHVLVMINFTRRQLTRLCARRRRERQVMFTYTQFLTLQSFDWDFSESARACTLAADKDLQKEKGSLGTSCADLCAEDEMNDGNYDVGRIIGRGRDFHPRKIEITLRGRGKESTWREAAWRRGI